MARTRISHAQFKKDREEEYKQRQGTKRRPIDIEELGEKKRRVNRGLPSRIPALLTKGVEKHLPHSELSALVAAYDCENMCERCSITEGTQDPEDMWWIGKLCKKCCWKRHQCADCKVLGCDEKVSEMELRLRTGGKELILQETVGKYCDLCAKDCKVVRETYSWVGSCEGCKQKRKVSLTFATDNHGNQSTFNHYFCEGCFTSAHLFLID